MLDQPIRHPDDTDADLPPQLPLAPCPWCAQVPVLDQEQHHGFFVACDSASCLIGPEGRRSFDTPEQAAQAWNARPVVQEVISQPA